MDLERDLRRLIVDGERALPSGYQRNRFKEGLAPQYMLMLRVLCRAQMMALLLGGGLALSSHGTKAATRVALNASPEPFSNSVASVI